MVAPIGFTLTASAPSMSFATARASKTMAHDQVKARRAYRALNAARTISETLTDSKGEPIWGVRSQLEYIDLHVHGYAEKGYSDPECGIIAVGNWNNVTRWNRETQQREVTSTLPSRLLKIFENSGSNANGRMSGRLATIAPVSYAHTPTVCRGNPPMWHL